MTSDPVRRTSGSEVGLHVGAWILVTLITFLAVLYLESVDLAWRLTTALFAPAPLVVYGHFLIMDRTFGVSRGVYAALTILLVLAASVGYGWWYHALFPEPDSYLGGLALVVVLIVVSTAARVIRRGPARSNVPAEQDTPAGTIESATGESFYVREGKVEYRLPADQIRLVHADGNYVHVPAPPRTVMVQATMKQLEDKLPPGRFLRVHRSYIINLEWIDYVDAGTIRIGADEVPIGRSYVGAVEEWIRARRL